MQVAIAEEKHKQLEAPCFDVMGKIDRIDRHATGNFLSIIKNV